MRTQAPTYTKTGQEALSDYITAIAWSPDGQILAASSAAGEVALFRGEERLHKTTLREADEQSINGLAFSADGQFLAITGQNGQVQIWQFGADSPHLLVQWDNPKVWIEKLAWHPQENVLAVAVGHQVQVWAVAAAPQSCHQLKTLDFENSSVLALDWQPTGHYLAVGGYQGIKIWTTSDWEQAPDHWALDSASIAIAWSPDGQYLASSLLDRTLNVWQWGNPHPWVMRGFLGKVRQIIWSSVSSPLATPLLIVPSAEDIIIWKKHSDPTIGWESRALAEHQGIVQAIALQPQSLLLASAATDKWLGLWQKAKTLTQILPTSSQGLSCLAWHPTGKQLAAGANSGEILLWSKSSRGQGFGG